LSYNNWNVCAFCYWVIGHFNHTACATTTTCAATTCATTTYY
jgi:hypothetical protein